MDYQKLVSQNIQRIIQSKGIKQTKVAELIGLPDSRLSALLHGKKIMRAEHIGTIANALEVSPNEFFKVEREVEVQPA